MEEKEIIGLIERYFEGDTSVEEERRLRDVLFGCESEDPRIIEAKAVLAYAGVAGVLRQEGTGRFGDRPSISGRSSSGREARAREASGRETSGRQAGTWRRMGNGWRVAASVAVVVVCGAAFFRLMQERGDCYTMIACVEGSSQDAAFNLIGSQLAAMGEASEEVDEDVRESLNLVFEL